MKAAQATFTGYEKMQYHSITSVVYSSLKTGFMIPIAIFWFGTFGAVVGTTIAYLLSGVIGVILLYVAVYKNIHSQDDCKLEIFVTVKTLFRYGLPLSISTILSGFLA